MKYAASLPLILALAACGQTDGELNPGNWKTTMTMTKFDIPGAPAEAVAALQSQLGKPDSEESCMSPAQAKAGIKDFASEMQQGECQARDFTYSGGRMTGNMICTDSDQGETTMRLAGTYAPELIEMTMSGEIRDASMPQGKAAVEMTIRAERIGECKS